MNVVAIVLFVAIGSIGGVAYSLNPMWEIPVLFAGLAVLTAMSPRVFNEWERGIVLRLGRFRRQIGPGVYWVMPFVDRVVRRVDQRVMTTSFLAEKALSRDTVPVNVDAVLFWHVWDAGKATLEVADYTAAVSWAAQTALRDMIGRTMLADLLSERESLDKQLREAIDAKTEPWGITVQSVEVRDVVIPDTLHDAMSRQAQAERERQARVILGDAENQIAEKFVEAAQKYEGSPSGLHLRAMNILYESLKEEGTMVIVPSSSLDAMSIGGVLGYANGQGDGPLAKRHRSSRVRPALPSTDPDEREEADAEKDLFGKGEEAPKP